MAPAVSLNAQPLHGYINVTVTGLTNGESLSVVRYGITSGHTHLSSVVRGADQVTVAGTSHVVADHESWAGDSGVYYYAVGSTSGSSPVVNAPSLDLVTGMITSPTQYSAQASKVAVDVIRLDTDHRHRSTRRFTMDGTPLVTVLPTDVGGMLELFTHSETYAEQLEAWLEGGYPLLLRTPHPELITLTTWAGEAPVEPYVWLLPRDASSTQEGKAGTRRWRIRWGHVNRPAT